MPLLHPDHETWIELGSPASIGWSECGGMVRSFESIGAQVVVLPEEEEDVECPECGLMLTIDEQIAGCSGCRSEGRHKWDEE